MGSSGAFAHPTHDHYAFALAPVLHEKEAPRIFNAAYQYGALAMRSAIWGFEARGLAQ